jgi:hypothetical protein
MGEVSNSTWRSREFYSAKTCVFQEVWVASFAGANKERARGNAPFSSRDTRLCRDAADCRCLRSFLRVDPRTDYRTQDDFDKGHDSGYYEQARGKQAQCISAEVREKDCESPCSGVPRGLPYSVQHRTAAFAGSRPSTNSRNLGVVCAEDPECPKV